MCASSEMQRTTGIIQQARRREVKLMARAAALKTLNLCLVFSIPTVTFLLVVSERCLHVSPCLARCWILNACLFDEQLHHMDCSLVAVNPPGRRMRGCLYCG